MATAFEFLTVKQVAQELGLSDSRVRHMILDGEIAATKLSDRVVLVSSDELKRVKKLRGM